MYQRCTEFSDYKVWANAQCWHGVSPFKPPSAGHEARRRGHHRHLFHRLRCFLHRCQYGGRAKKNVPNFSIISEHADPASLLHLCRDRSHLPLYFCHLVLCRLSCAGRTEKVAQTPGKFFETLLCRAKQIGSRPGWQPAPWTRAKPGRRFFEWVRNMSFPPIDYTMSPSSFISHIAFIYLFSRVF